MDQTVNAVNDAQVQTSAEGLSISHGAAFSSPVVLETIFKHSNARDLKEFRLVNKLWNEASLTVLIKRRLLKLTVSDCPYKLQQKYTFPSSALVEVNSHFSDASKRLPFTCLDLDMSCWNDTTSSTLIHSFGLFGASITTLMLSQCSNTGFQTGTIERLRDLLSKYFHNVKELFLEHLSLVNMYFRKLSDRDQAKLFNEPISLPALKAINLGRVWLYPSVIRELIAVSPNLDSILNFDIRWIDIMEENGKIGLIKEYYHNYEYGYPCKTFRFANLQPKLKSLIVPNSSQIVYNNESDKEDEDNGLEEFVAFRRILRSSKDSLESLTCFPFDLLRPNPDEHPLPSFDKLKTLCLRSFNRQPVFPNELDVLEIFPAVDTIVLWSDFKRINRRSMLKYFPQDDFDEGLVQSWLNVKTLEIKFGCTVDHNGWSALGKKFPNVKHLKGESVKSLFGSEEGLELFLPWTELESMELCGFTLNSLIGVQLDSFLTGVPSEVIKNLFRSESGQEKQDIEWKALKTRAGISDFLDLTKIRIVFDHKSNAGWTLPDSCKTNPMKSYSWDFGFNSLPKLRSAIFAFDQEIYNSRDVKFLLERVAPWIRFEHEPLNLKEDDRNYKNPKDCQEFHMAAAMNGVDLTDFIKSIQT